MLVLRWIVFGLALVASFLLGVWAGSGPSRWRYRRWVTLRALLARHRAGDEWTFGRALVDHSQGTIGRSWIYIVLAELEDDTLVESEPEPNPHSANLARRRYRLTERGVEVVSSVENGREKLIESGRWE